MDEVKVYKALDKPDNKSHNNQEMAYRLALVIRNKLLANGVEVPTAYRLSKYYTLDDLIKMHNAVKHGYVVHLTLSVRNSS